MKRQTNVRTVERQKRVVSYITVTRKVVTVEPPYVAFGQAVRQGRLDAGMTQEQLATKSGLTRASIANIENGRQRVLLGDLWAFAKALGIPARKLFNTIEAA